MGNNSKQAVLSIIGIAILVIAVVGVSFAFFTYSKTGTTNNVITTGSISFEYTEAVNGLTVEDAFPQTPAEGKLNDSFTFHVTSNLPSSANNISYTVTAVKGDVPTGYTEATDRMADSQINLYVTTSGSSATISNGYDGTNGAVAGNSTTGFEIATGTVTAGTTNYDATFVMTMWVNQTVTISDTDATKTYRASDSSADYPSSLANRAADTRKIYSDMYYSLKINVNAND